jgi:hypothetical protein
LRNQQEIPKAAPVAKLSNAIFDITPANNKNIFAPPFY